MLITLADAKAYLGILTADTDNDDILTGMINAVGTQFDNYTDRELEASDYTIQIDGNGLDHIFLRNYPINEITSIHIDADRVFGDDSEITSDYYVKYDNDGEIALVSSSFWGGVLPKVRQSVKIVANLGYTVTAPITLPADIIKACKDQVKYLYRKWNNNEEGVSSYSATNSSITITEDTGLITMVKKVLDKYVSRYHGCL